jgi:hypothetical protein
MLPRMPRPDRVPRKSPGGGPLALRLLPLFGSLLVPVLAFAQVSAGPPTPLVTDLGKVPTGSWARYAMTVGTMPPMSMMIGLVAKTPAGDSLEMAIEAGMPAKVVTQVTLKGGPDWDGKPQKVVVQVGANEPIQMPTDGIDGRFAKPDPKTFLKDETLKVAAGSFKTKHYRSKTAQGDTTDFWVTTAVAPIGLVKMVLTQKSNPMLSGPITMELSAVGKDAKPAITRPAKPGDKDAVMKQMMAAAGAAPPAAK